MPVISCICNVQLTPINPMTPEEKEELRQLFKNNSDCYADTGRFENDGNYSEGEVIQAMTEERFLKVVASKIEEREKAHNEEMQSFQLRESQLSRNLYQELAALKAQIEERGKTN